MPTEQTRPDALAAIDAVLADAEQPVRAATVDSSRDETLADLQALRGHHKDLVTVLNATREALHLPADCDRNAIPATAAEKYDAARNLTAQRDDLAARLDAERLNAHTWATRAGFAKWDRDRLQQQRDEMQNLAKFRLGVIRRHTDETTAAGRIIAVVRDTVEQLDRAGVTIEALDRALAAYDAPGDLDATLAQIRRDATQLRADLDAGRVSDHLGDPASARPQETDWSHEIAFDTDGTWSIGHPNGCPGQVAGNCDVARLATEQLPGRHMYTGMSAQRFWCGVNNLGDRFLLGDLIEVPPARPQELDLVALIPWIRRALADPGSIAGRRRGPHWPETAEGWAEEEETLTDWTARALRLVLGSVPACERCERPIGVDDDYDPPLPGIGPWEPPARVPAGDDPTEG